MIEKMKFVNITGPSSDIDRVINQYLSKYEMHLENPMLELEAPEGLSPYVEINPYKEYLSKCKDLFKYIPEKKVSGDIQLSVETAEKIIDSNIDTIKDIKTKLDNLSDELTRLQDDYNKVSPFIDLNYDLGSILNFDYVKFRFGKIPKEYFLKLQAYTDDNVSTIFLKCSTDDKYVWGIYFVPFVEAGKVDAAYTSLHFERTYIPRTLKGTPAEVCVELQKKITNIKNESKNLEESIIASFEKNSSDIYSAYKRISIAHENFDVRKTASHTIRHGVDFYIICGWMTADDATAFKNEISNDEDVVCIVDEDEKAHHKLPPTKLKNPKIFKPFEMFIKMYGLPAYNEIDPTIFVAITYTFIFGAMFGDVGQGLLLVVAGYLLYLTKKMDLAAIIGTAGIFSTFFGFMFGSIFGFEDIIDAVWLRPVAAMTDVPFIGKLNTVFVVAIGFGMCLILITMVMHIINGIKSHDAENTYFDTNALAGLVFYGSLTAIIALLMAGMTVPAAIVLVIMFGIPLILIALKEPITHMITKTKPEEKTGIGMFITQTFFEIFEVLLSYFSNTLSFIRIGAFAVSHASMMEVVLMLAGAESGSPNIIVVIFGNLFVVCLEGLIVGIQVLRLEYYELFSRYYKGNGREFKPFKHAEKNKS